jgi:2-C-methyl-D-erythritol 4-phosphate cytidylyltransferase
MEKLNLIIVAGGSGTRMGTDIPKQFLRINGIPVLIHTLRIFKETLPTVVPWLVLPESHHAFWNELYNESGAEFPHSLVVGGPTRFHSVKNGLQNISSGLVVVHDGVRPLVNPLTISSVIEKAGETGAAIPGIPVNESLREKTGSGTKIVNRTDFLLIQTPQCFAYDLMKSAFDQEYREEFTDCASVLEYNGKKVAVVEGNRENIKITLPTDLVFAEALLKRR